MVTRLTAGIVYRILLALVAIVAACAPAAPLSSQPLSGPTQTPDATPPPSPGKPALSVAPGTTNVTAAWDAVAEADSYLVKWRHRRTDFAADNQLTVAEPMATFTPPYQGAWIVRVTACNEHGCGKPATAYTSVIINIPGRTAVRTWHTENTINLDWDPLPGSYFVKYRTSVDNTKWKSSPLLSEVGFAITGDDLSDFSREKGIGHTIIRVYFNCTDDGEKCELLGKYPDTEAQQIHPSLFQETPPNPYTTSDATAQGQSSTSERVRDPITSLWRPASDFTITYEDDPDEDITYTCGRVRQKIAGKRLATARLLKGVAPLDLAPLTITYWTLTLFSRTKRDVARVLPRMIMNARNSEKRSKFATRAPTGKPAPATESQVKHTKAPILYTGRSFIGRLNTPKHIRQTQCAKKILQLMKIRHGTTFIIAD